jgi:hypothetical protein
MSGDTSFVVGLVVFAAAALLLGFAVVAIVKRSR